MSERLPESAQPSRNALVGGAVLLGLLGLLAVGLVALVLLSRAGALPSGAGSAVATPNPSGFAYAPVRAAPPLELTDQDGRPFTLSSLRGRPVLVFFGYTHCPDVCPVTVGIVSQAVAAAGDGPRVVFASIDPERDDVAAMKTYLRYLPAAFIGLSGGVQDTRRNADAWGVKYAKIEQGSPGGYAMAHTADVFLVDAAGRLRAHFPFGTQAEPIAASLTSLLAETPVSGAGAVATSTPTSTATPVAPSIATAPPSSQGTDVQIYPEVVSTSIWAGGHDPVILKATDSRGNALDGSVPLAVQLATTDGTAVGSPVTATAVRPEGETRSSFVAMLDIPAPGAWKLLLTSGAASGSITGSIAIQALDPGTTAALGGLAPDVRTPTLADVGGVVRAVTTQPDPDLRLSRTSTADARAAGKPYVIVIDSARFKVSPACGRALTMVRYLVDRWPGVAFIHLEPFEYQVITAEPVLSGSLTNPPMNQWSRAFGLGDATWPGTRMPWIFVVDGHGIVRAKYTGIVGTADVDVILSLISGKALR
jgi:protein SCO1/2